MGKYFIGILLLVSEILYAQESYSPYIYDSTAFEHYIELTEERFISDLASLKGIPKTERKEYEAIFERRFDRIIGKYEHGCFYTDPEVTGYFQNILNKILQANPQLPQDIRLVVSRDPWANAACYGEGTIMFNLDMLRFLENESEIAFILCHELAHYQQNHVNKSIEKYVTALYSEEMQKQLMKLYRASYNTFTQAEELLKKYMFNDRRHSRGYEHEADSVGFELLKNSPYNESAALTALAKLDSVDEEQYKDLHWDKLLHFEKQPFKSSWKKSEGGLAALNTGTGDIGEEAELDSLKTHPDCPIRIEHLKGLPMGNNKAMFVQDKAMFDHLKQMAAFEYIENLYFYGNKGKSLFMSFQMHAKYPADAYLNTQIVKCLYELYQAKDEHEFSNYVATPYPKAEENYKMFLQILNNQRMSEIGGVGYYFGLSNLKSQQHNEAFIYYLSQLAKINDEMEMYQQLVTSYKDQFPNGEYITDL